MLNSQEWNQLRFPCRPKRWSPLPSVGRISSNAALWVAGFDILSYVGPAAVFGAEYVAYTSCGHFSSIIRVRRVVSPAVESDAIACDLPVLPSGSAISAPRYPELVSPAQL